MSAASPGPHPPGPRRPPLLVGWGNPLRGDDGAGRLLAERLRAEVPAAALRVVATHQLTAELAEAVAEAPVVVFADASCTAPPGAVEQLALAPAATRAGDFTHHCHPAELLRLAREVYGRAPEAAWLVTIGGEAFGFGEALSPAVARALPLARARLARLLGLALPGGP